MRLDPYANAFYREPHEVGHWESDHTDMRPGVHERKYELDSLCTVLRLACGFYSETRDASCFDAEWLVMAGLLVNTIRDEQVGSERQGDSPACVFRRTTPFASDTLNNQGRGNPFVRTGMSRCAFRPSDDATTYQFLVPANAMAVVCLRELANMLDETALAPHLSTDARSLAAEIDAGIRRHARVDHDRFGPILAYEVDGYGGRCLMDDANMPGLLSLPYLGYCDAAAPLYAATRDCLRQLVRTHAGTGFMHEAYWKDDAARFTRPWFAWANTLFGELVLTLSRTRPHLIENPL